MSASADRMDVAAELRGVTKRFGAVEALRGVDLCVPRRGVTALLGPNGAGKTTAVKLLLGLSRPTSGSVSVLGGNPRDAATRERFGAMLQVGKVPETLRVREHIDLFRTYYPNPLPAADVLQVAGLTQLADRLFGTLSGGEKQRVLFALALSGNPDLLVLDEPTLGFDVESRRAFWESIASLAKGGRSILLTTHYLEEADALADRIVVIDRGQIVAEGTGAEIKARTAGKRVRCATSLSVEFLRSLPGVHSVRHHSGRYELLVTIAEPVVRELLERDPDLSDLEVTGGALEDAFLAITGSAESELVGARS